MKAKDYKILKYILDIIQEYKMNRMDFYSLVNDLNVFYRELEHVDESWSTVFFDQWMNLESINSYLLIHNKQETPLEYKNILNVLLKKITDVTEQLLRRDLLEIDNITESAIELDNFWFMCPFCQNVWESSNLRYRMIRCPNCYQKLLNPKYGESTVD